MPTKRETFIPSLRAQWLGVRMRELREKRDLNLKEVATFLGVEFSTLARYERAEWPFKTRHLVELLDFYGVTDEDERQTFADLGRQRWRLNRWDADTGAEDHELPFASYRWVQNRAVQICTYGTVCIPPLLQTREYADALVRAIHDELPAHKIANAVQDRMERRKILERTPTVRVTAVIEEAALRRAVGGTAVLRPQLEHLRELVARPEVDIRVMPETVFGHPGLHGAFTLFHMRQPYPPVAYLEHLGGFMWLESERAERYARVYQNMLETALSPSLSAVHFAELIEEL
jgi:transcriptional regulator with XRE-family HTH domain